MNLLFAQSLEYKYILELILFILLNINYYQNNIQLQIQRILNYSLVKFAKYFKERNLDINKREEQEIFGKEMDKFNIYCCE